VAADFPRPMPNADDAPFWEGCREHELRLQRCNDCGAFRHHPRPRCPECQSAAFTWTPVSGRGTVASFTICHPPVLPAFAERVPYNAAVVQLEEGPFMVTNLVDIENDDIVAGMPVAVEFRDVDDGVTLPQFRPTTVTAS
jgi:uncharacterized protein